VKLGEPPASLENTEKHGAMQMAAGFGEPQNSPRIAEPMPMGYRSAFLHPWTFGRRCRKTGL